MRSISSMATSSMSKRSSMAYTRLRNFVACNRDSIPDIMRGKCVCSIYVLIDGVPWVQNFYATKKIKEVLIDSRW